MRLIPASNGSSAWNGITTSGAGRKAYASKRARQEELAQLEALTKEGLTVRDIAQRLDRSPAAIRNLRYKKHLVIRVQDETKVLFQQRDELSNMVEALQGQKA